MTAEDMNNDALTFQTKVSLATVTTALPGFNDNGINSRQSLLHV